MKFALAILAITIAALPATQAALLITEVNPSGSGNGNYGADWFELTNTGTIDLDITGWRVDDNSNSFGSGLTLRGVTTIPAGKSVIFFESNASGTNDASIADAFKLAWFGANVPSGFLIGAYGGSGIGLSQTGDAVNIFNSAGTTVARVDFGAATDKVSFDNTAGLNNVTLSTLSVAGTNGAFTNSIGEVGSPGVAIVPEPASTRFLLGGAALLGLRRSRK